MKTYQCICGNTFDNSQKFNAHKSHCKMHYINKYGNLDRYYANESVWIKNFTDAARRRGEQIQAEKLSKWISEQHTCERCGKVMTEYFGTGRFCSRHCANIRSHSDETRIKISEALCGHSLSDSEKYKLLNKKHVPKYIYDGPQLPIISVKRNHAGYFNRSIRSVPELFWKTILDENNISYQYDYVVHKPKGENGVFRIDFLVDNYDIEIDGNLHKRQCIKDKDKRRDQYLQSLGYTVYRINWVNPSNDKNKFIVNEQINNLFKFIGKIRVK